MKLTPLDIHHKEFRHSLRGYSEEEVDQFLDQIADEFERLFKENIELSEKMDALQNKVNEFELQRQTINNTLLNAQRSADDIISRAEGEAESIVSHANLRAKEIVNDALAKKQQVRGELLRIKQAEEEFRERYKALLETNLRAITEVGIADDVSVLLGDTEEPSEPTFAPPAAPPAAVQVAPQPVPQVEPEPRFVPEPEPQPAEPVMPAAPFSMSEDVAAQPVFESDFLLPEMTPVEAVSPDEPAPAPFVESVALGEVEAPEIPADVDLVEPSEFSLPGFAALGEREDDSDIEEID